MCVAVRRCRKLWNTAGPQPCDPPCTPCGFQFQSHWCGLFCKRIAHGPTFAKRHLCAAVDLEVKAAPEPKACAGQLWLWLTTEKRRTQEEFCFSRCYVTKGFVAGRCRGDTFSLGSSIKMFVSFPQRTQKEIHVSRSVAFHPPPKKTQKSNDKTK